MSTTAHTVIYTHGGGRLGNQVLRFMHWMAWVRAHEGRVEVLNLAFWPYAEFFALWRDHPGCVFPVRAGIADRLARRRTALPRAWREMSEARSRLPRMVQAVGRWMPGWQAVSLDGPKGESADLEDASFLAKIEQSPVTAFSGWKVASWRLLAEQQDELRPFFQPAEEFARRTTDFMQGLRQRHEVVVGLLIRQSDYRQWHDGRFCFSTTQYVTWIKELLDLYGGQRVAVLVASEEHQDPVLFAGLPVFFATGAANSGGHWFESWIELSQCDLVVSPPSTFSATAVFLGAIPLWPLVSVDQKMTFNQILVDGMLGAARHPVFSLAVK